MANPITNAVEDPFDGDSIPSTAFHHVQSTTKGGSYPDIVAPAAHNYPDTSATRTFIYLPEAIDQSDLLGSRPMTVTGSSFGNMTRVGTSPGAGEYRIPNTTTSSRPHIIEINSGQWGETISFDYYGTGTIHNSSGDDQLIDGNLVVSGDSSAAAFNTYAVATSGNGQLLKQVASTATITFELKKPVTAWFQWAGLGTYTFEIWSGGAWTVIHNAVSTDKTNQHLNPAYYRLSHASGPGVVNMFITGVFGISDITNTSDIST
jgi:hypothetical protein